ncbi:hypothetical protein HZH66_010443 [Vespula vulgaris]|uniref:Uncharacterized protein n=2 Tax=Vespula TaxID=7451 RepID=A0A834NR43_VESPE|nr:hypothetical protein HZH66_010443 [Vespula vulgaris]KAF7415943.1 hypothetical protein H0235_012535 [Vespula pensylvanica]
MISLRKVSQKVMDVEQQQVVVPVVFGISLSYGGLLRMPSLADCESGLPRYSTCKRPMDQPSSDCDP